MTDTIDQTAMQSAAQTEQSIAVIVEHRPEIVLIDEGKRDALFAHIEEEIAAFVPDMTTNKGRDECRALAAKVTKTKTAIDKARLKLTEDARAKIKLVNASGADVEEKLKAMADQVRAPLTAWEAAEDTRVAECKAALERFRTAAIVPLDATADSLRTRITEVDAEPMHEDHWQGMLPLAETAKATALEALTAALAIVEQKERDAAELDALRAAAAEREAREAQEREIEIARAAEALQRNEYIDSFIQHITEIGLGMIGGQPQPYGILISDLEERIPPEIETFGERRDEVERHRVATLERVKEAMERQRVKAAEAEQAAEGERLRLETATAEERANAEKAAAEAAAQAARAEEQARATQQAAEQAEAHAAELAAANERAAETERKAEAERALIAEETRQREAAEAAAAAERARLEADQNRRTAVKRAAKEALMTSGITEDQAKAIVLMLIAGEVPYCFLDFSAEPRVKQEAAD